MRAKKDMWITIAVVLSYLIGWVFVASDYYAMLTYMVCVIQVTAIFVMIRRKHETFEYRQASGLKREQRFYRFVTCFFGIVSVLFWVTRISMYVNVILLLCSVMSLTHVLLIRDALLKSEDIQCIMK